MLLVLHLCGAVKARSRKCGTIKITGLENAGVKISARYCRGWKIQEWKQRHDIATGGKCKSEICGDAFATSQQQAHKDVSATVRHPRVHLSAMFGSYKLVTAFRRTPTTCVARLRTADRATTKNLTPKTSRTTRHRCRRPRTPTCRCRQLRVVSHSVEGSAHCTGTLRPQRFFVVHGLKKCTTEESVYRSPINMLSLRY